MTFDHRSGMTGGRARRAPKASRMAAAVLTALGAVFACAAQAGAEQRMALIPTQIIYPGEPLDRSRLEMVPVTNPNIAPGYVTSFEEVDGLVSKRTLLPGRIILTAALREEFAVQRGSQVRLVFSNGPLVITAGGSPLQDAAIGDLIRVRNTDSGVIVSGTVMADGTIQVVAK